MMVATALRDFYEFDGDDVSVPTMHPFFRFGRRRERLREFVFTRKDDAIFEMALREKFPGVLILLQHPGNILRFEKIPDLYADNRRGRRWLILPQDRNWMPLVEVTSDPTSPTVRTRLRNLPARWLAYSRSHWKWADRYLIDRATAFDWPYLMSGGLWGQSWDLDPSLDSVKAFYRTAFRIISRIASDRAKHGSRLMNEATGGDYKRMADLERCHVWFGHCALEWSRAGGERKMLDSFYRPADDWEVPNDPWYQRLKTEVEAKYGVDFGLPPKERPDDGEYSTP